MSYGQVYTGEHATSSGTRLAPSKVNWLKLPSYAECPYRGVAALSRADGRTRTPDLRVPRGAVRAASRCRDLDLKPGHTGLVPRHVCASAHQQHATTPAQSSVPRPTYPVGRQPRLYPERLGAAGLKLAPSVCFRRTSHSPMRTGCHMSQRVPVHDLTVREPIGAVSSQISAHCCSSKGFATRGDSHFLAIIWHDRRQSVQRGAFTYVRTD